MDKELTCTICNQQYKQTNVPRLLPKCGHSFCENCIKSSMTPTESGESVKIVCPEDRQEMLFDDEDINNFPKNIALIKLLTKDSKRKDESFKDSSLNESNIAKHSVNEADEQDKQLITAINQSTKDNRSEDLELNLDDMCLIHQKPLQIVCIRDKTKICSTCAIFGDHKGHQFKSLDEVAKDKEKRCDGILTLIDQKEALETKVTGKETKQQLAKTLLTKKENLCREIKDRFTKIVETVKATEKKALDKITKYFIALEQKLKEDLKIPDATTKKYIKWQQRAYHQIQAFDGENNFLEQLSLLNYERNNEQLNIIEEGDKIIKEIDSVISALEQYKNESVGSITLQFNAQMEKKLPELVVIKEAKKTLQLDKPTGRQSVSATKFKDIYDKVAPPKRLSTQEGERPSYREKEPEVNHAHPHSLEDDLLGAHEQGEEDEPMVVEVREVRQQIKIPSLQLKEPEVPKPPSMSRLPPPSPQQFSSPPDTARKLAGSGLKDASFNFQKAPAKKKPKIKLPEKYEKILDGIINDQLETVDFTNAELGDQVMIQIIECMKGRKVKTLKLIRNKLTDEGMDKMLPYFSNVITLNLSQNLLTDRFIDRLLAFLPKMPNLKSLILSQNKIKQRNVKTRLEEIKKYDVVVSL